LSSYEDDEVGSQTTKAKKSVATAGRPSLKNAHGAGGSASASANNFLTAAEQRAQAMKEEKKSQEDAFSFLLDVRDVGCIIITETPVDSRDLLAERRCPTRRTRL
jgi:DNA mismatch repair protein MSH6